MLEVQSCKAVYFSMKLPSGSTRSLQALLAPSAVTVCALQCGIELGAPIEVGVGGREVADVHAASSLQSAPVGADELVFFRVVHHNLAMPVRTKAHGQESLSGVKSIVMHRLLELTPDTETCVISITPLLTHGRLEPVTLQLRSLSTQSLRSLQVWEKSPDVKVHFANHVAVPADLLPNVPEVVEVIATGPTPREVFDSGGPLEVVKFLVEQGLVHGPPWELTVAGKQSIECGVLLFEAKSVARRLMPGEPLDDATVYELILQLQHEGFEMFEVADKAEVKTVRKTAYQPLAVKRWFVKALQPTDRFYLRCLLQCDQAHPEIKEVQHFQKSKVYQKMLGLEVSDVKPRVSSGLEIEDDFSMPLQPEKKKRVRKGKPRSKKPASKVQVDDGKGDVADSEPEDGDEHGDSDDDDSSSDSSSSSSKSQTSKSSSSNSPSGSADADADAEPAAPAQPRGPPLDHNMNFGRHRLTYYANRKGQEGYQCTCKKHTESSSACTRSTKIDDQKGGEDGTLRRLKWWAWLGMDESCTTKAQHRDLWAHVEDSWQQGLVPSSAQLDAYVQQPVAAPAVPAAPAAPAEPAQAVPAPEAKRRRRSKQQDDQHDDQ